MDTCLATVAATPQGLLWQLREGTLSLADALHDPTLANERAHELIGASAIASQAIEPGATALATAKYAAVEHGQLVAELTNTQRTLLVYATRRRYAA